MIDFLKKQLIKFTFKCYCQFKLPNYCYLFVMQDMYEDYVKQIKEYKKERVDEIKRDAHPKNVHLITEQYVLMSKTIKRDELAIKGSHHLFQQLALLVKTIKNRQEINKGPFSSFLSIDQYFQFSDQNQDEITYFINSRTKTATYLSINTLINIWNTLIEMQRHQLFVLNLTLENFSSQSSLLNLNNLIILKRDYQVSEDLRSTCSQQCWKVCSQMIINSNHIIRQQSFYQLIKDKIDPTFPEHFYNLASFYYLHHCEFIKLVKIQIEILQKAIDMGMNRQLVKYLKRISQIELGSPYNFDRKFFNEKIEKQLNECIRISETQASSSQIRKYYQYPLTTSFDEYTEQQRNILIHTCKNLLDKDRINIDLLEYLFNFILDPRDFLYLESDLKQLHEKQLLESQSLLQLEDTIDASTKNQLAKILKDSNQQIINIFKEVKSQSCHFNITRLNSSYQGNNTDLLYHNYWQYKNASNKEGISEICQIHDLPKQYKCGCALLDQNHGLCYFCLQLKHINHPARCIHHNELIRYKFHLHNEQPQLQQYFGCDSCKAQWMPSQQIECIRICSLHRHPIKYFCKQIDCNLQSKLCFHCIKNHEDHKESISKIIQSEQSNIKLENMMPQRDDLKKILSKQKFFKFYQIYSGQIRPVEYFLNYLKCINEEDSHNSNDYLNYFINYSPNLEDNEDIILSLKIRSFLESYDEKSLTLINEYFSDQMESLTSNLFRKVKEEVDQLERKAMKMMYDPNLLQNAQDYLNQKYEIITNIRNSRMEEIMQPARLCPEYIPQHHLPRIRKVVIDQTVQKQNEIQYKNGEESDNFKLYQKQIIKCWKQFYQTQDSLQYRQLQEQVRTLQRNEKLYEKNIINREIKRLERLIDRTSQNNKKQQYQEQIQQLLQYPSDGRYLYQQMHEIEENIDIKAIQSYQKIQSPKLQQFQLAKKMPNLQHYQLKLLSTRHNYLPITSEQVASLFNSTNLNYLYFDYQCQGEDIKSLFKRIPQQNFNKKPYYAIEYDNTQCLIWELANNDLSVQDIAKLSRHFHFGSFCLQVSLDPEENVPSLRKFMKICENLDSFGIGIDFNSDDFLNDMSEDYEDMTVDSRQAMDNFQTFLNDIFTYFTYKPHLHSLRLQGLNFSPASNRIFRQVIQSNNQLLQLSLQKCHNLEQDCLQNINPQLQTLQIIQHFSILEGLWLSRLISLQRLALENVDLNINFLSLRNLRIKETLISLTLVNISIVSFNHSQYSFKNILEIFKECSLHDLVIQDSLINPYDFEVLSTVELSSLKIGGCNKITRDSLLYINKKWPNLESIDLSGCHFIKIKDPKIWLSFKKAVDIAVNRISITEKQLYNIRINGKNIRAVIV